MSDLETSQFFIAKAADLVKHNGKVSFIIPNTLFLNLFTSDFRQFIVNTFSINKVANLSNVDVFDGSTVRTMIPFLTKSRSKKNSIDLVVFHSLQDSRFVGIVDQKKLAKDDKQWVALFENSKTKLLKDKIKKLSVPLGEILEISQGLIPYDKYRGHSAYTIKHRIWHAEIKKDKTYKRELRGGDVTRYPIHWNGKQWISYGSWLAAPRDPKFFTQPRLLFREITNSKSGLIHVAYTEDEFYNNPGIINCVSRNTQYLFFYLLGLCASRLIAYLHFNSSPKARKGIFPKILVNDVRNLPIRSINFKDFKEKSQHDKIVSLVEKMLILHKEKEVTKSEVMRDRIEREINVVNEKIDTLVYSLYKLTKEEIKLIETCNYSEFS